MTKPTSADGQINNKNKQISRSEASLQGWTNEFGAEIWVENAGKTKWRVKFCSSCSPPVSTAPSATFGWCLTATGLPLFSISTSISHLHFLFFFPKCWSPQTLPGNLVSSHSWMETPGMLDWDGQWWSAKNPDLDMFFTIWFEENIKEKGKTYGFVLNLGLVNMTCTASCTRVWKTLLCPFPNKFMIHRWAVVSISIFCQGSGILLEILFTAITDDYL